MPYTERQLHCLSAMGLVAWRQRVPLGQTSPGAAMTGDVIASGSAVNPAAEPPVAPAAEPPVAPAAELLVAPAAELPVAPAAEPPVAPAAEPLVAPVLATPLPREPAALAAWLPDQPLAPFTWKERRLTRIGRADAPLLVVVERASGEGLPLSGPAAELFERMLESIGRTRRDTCQCVLANEPRPDGDTVATLAGSGRPTTLVLLQGLDAGEDAASCRLPGDPFGGPAWCLPHPERLLAEPLGKRLAWEVLKALRAHLPDPS